MKIQYNIEPKTPIDRIAYGECFELDGDICMRVDSSEYDYVNLKTGKLGTADIFVNPIEADLKWLYL